MAYQFGILTGLVLLSMCVTAAIVAGIWQGELAVALSGMVVIGLGLVLLYLPGGFVRRLQQLFTEGVPLAPYGFRRNATLGYWLGIPLIYVGHAITLGTFVLGWELLRRPVSGVPIGIAFAYAIMAYGLGIGMVESSYSYWAKRLNGVAPGDAGSNPLRPFLWTVAAASLLTALLIISALTQRSDAISARARSPAPATAPGPVAPTERVQLVDFLVLTEPGWTGYLAYREGNSKVFAREPATMRAALMGGDTLRLSVEFPDASRAAEELSFQLSENGSYLNALAIVRRMENQGVLRVVAYGDGLDEGKRSRVRTTLTVSAGEFKLERHVEIASNQFMLRSEYGFSRPPED